MQKPSLTKTLVSYRFGITNGLFYVECLRCPQDVFYWESSLGQPLLTLFNAVIRHDTKHI